MSKSIDSTNLKIDLIAPSKPRLTDDDSSLLKDTKTFFRGSEESLEINVGEIFNPKETKTFFTPLS